MASQDQDLADDIRNAVLKYLEDSDDDGESEEEQDKKDIPKELALQVAIPPAASSNAYKSSIADISTMVVPHEASPLAIDGRWNKGTIEGKSLRWPDGDETPIDVISPTEISMTFEGALYNATLHEDDGQLYWNDGDVWYRLSEARSQQYEPQVGSSFSAPLLQNHLSMGTHSPVESLQTLQPPQSNTNPQKLGGFSEMGPAQVSPPCEMPFLECMRNLLSSGGIPFDILLVADDGELPAHNYFLSSRSVVFKSMLQGIPRPEPWDPLPAIPLHGVKIEVLRYLLEYVYTDTCKFSVETIEGTDIDVVLQLYDIAKRYGMVGLKEYLYDDIISVFAESFPETVHRISQLKDLYNAANNEGHQVGNLLGFQTNPSRLPSDLVRNPYVPDLRASWIALAGENVNPPFAVQDQSWSAVANGALATTDSTASRPGFIDRSGETLALHQQKHQAFSSHHWPAMQEQPNSTLIQDQTRKTTFAELIHADSVVDPLGSSHAQLFGTVTGGKQQPQKTKPERAETKTTATSHPKEDTDAKKGSHKSSGATTMMVRNLPQTLKQRDLIKELNDSGFAGAYDFLYLPSTFGTSAGKSSLQRNGYAFINFEQASVASQFIHRWNGSKYFSSKGAEALSVAAAECQGLEVNMRSWLQKGRRIRNPELRPYVKVAGRVMRTDSKTFIEDLQMIMKPQIGNGQLNTDGDSTSLTEHNISDAPEEEDTLQAPTG